MGFNEFKDEYSKKNSDPKAIKDITCKKWIDVRTFGQVFPFKGLGSVSTGIRGCMSLSPAIKYKYLVLDLAMDFQLQKRKDILFQI